MPKHLAQLNVGTLVAPVDDPQLAEFVRALDAVNLLAESSEGFVWRLVDEDGRSSTFIAVGDDPQFAINLSVWESLDALRHFTYRSGHSVYLRRRREWFKRHEGPHLVCWWVDEGHLPTVEEAMARLDALREKGPTEEAFTLADPFDPPVA